MWLIIFVTNLVYFSVLVPKRLLVKTTTSVQWSGRRLGPAKLARLIRKIRWFHLPLSFALTLAAFSQFRKFRVNQIRRELADDEDNPFRLYRPTSLELKMYHMLPLRTISRLWGWINSFELPGPIRVPILRSYARMFGCDLDEALMEDLNQYRNLGEFFRRSLKPGLRPIEGDEDAIVSPADGTVLHMGSAKDGLLEQVKGITYAIESFLGPITWKEDAYKDGLDYQQALLHHHDPASGQNATDLYYAVIYLAPGDYHRFHSPVEWTIKYRRHFPGKLYSVRPTFASWFPNLFAVNERVAYVGEWKHGFFSMAPVGAVNVGSMNIYFDEVC